MKIVGHQKTSFIDYPEKISSVIFVAGCNFRCPYCHNGHIVNDQGMDIHKEEFFSFLKNRKKFIDGVCISGGEPTLYSEIQSLIERIKEEGFLVKLDTNGTNPTMVKELLNKNLLDYVAMDIKAPLNKYDLVTSSTVNKQSIKESVDLIKNSQIDYEFRTTVCKELITKEDIFEIVKWIEGSRRYYIQNFKDGDTVIGGKGVLHPYEEASLLKIVDEISDKFGVCKLRK